MADTIESLRRENARLQEKLEAMGRELNARASGKNGDQVAFLVLHHNARLRTFSYGVYNHNVFVRDGPDSGDILDGVVMEVTANSYDDARSTILHRLAHGKVAMDEVLSMMDKKAARELLDIQTPP